MHNHFSKENWAVSVHFILENNCEDNVKLDVNCFHLTIVHWVCGYYVWSVKQYDNINEENVGSNSKPNPFLSFSFTERRNCCNIILSLEHLLSVCDYLFSWTLKDNRLIVVSVLSINLSFVNSTPYSLFYEKLIHRAALSWERCKSKSEVLTTFPTECL